VLTSDKIGGPADVCVPEPPAIIRYTLELFCNILERHSDSRNLVPHIGLNSVGTAGCVGGFNLHLMSSTPCCLFVLGVTCNDHRSHLQFLCHKNVKNLLVNTSWHGFLKLKCTQTRFRPGLRPRARLGGGLPRAPRPPSRLDRRTPLKIHSPPHPGLAFLFRTSL